MERQVVLQRDRVDRGVHAAARQKRRHGRRKAQTTWRAGQVQRFDAQAVAAQQDPAAVALDDAEREHAGDPLDEGVAPLDVCLDEYFGVAGREEAIAALLEVAPQLRVVVDHAVEGDRDAEVRVDHRLRRPIRQVDDLQAAMRERDGPLCPRSGTVRPTPLHRRAHGCHRADVCRRAIKPDLTREAAHEWFAYPDGRPLMLARYCVSTRSITNTRVSPGLMSGPAPAAP